MSASHSSQSELEENSFSVISSTGNESIYIKEWKSKTNLEIKHHFIILHDICDHHGRYELLGKFLWDHFNGQVHITFMDFKGHGLSSGSRSYIENIDEYVDDLKGVIENDDNYDIKKIIIGQGLGGLVALSYIEANDDVARNRIGGIILSNPLLFLHLELHKIHDKALRSINKYAGKVRFPYHIDGREMTSDQLRYEDYNSDPLINHYMSISLVEEVIRKSRKLLNYSYYLDVPVLMLLSKNDFLVNWEKCSLFLKGMPKKLSSERIYPHTLHDLFNEKNRDKVYTDIYNWVNETL
jgi:alpha-beta hydrolase superfamily lysophospholipase